jgi:hypothetical protein
MAVLIRDSVVLLNASDKMTLICLDIIRIVSLAKHALMLILIQHHTGRLASVRSGVITTSSQATGNHLVGFRIEFHIHVISVHFLHSESIFSHLDRSIVTSTLTTSIETEKWSSGAVSIFFGVNVRVSGHGMRPRCGNGSHR